MGSLVEFKNEGTLRCNTRSGASGAFRVIHSSLYCKGQLQLQMYQHDIQHICDKYTILMGHQQQWEPQGWAVSPDYRELGTPCSVYLQT